MDQHRWGALSTEPYTQHTWLDRVVRNWVGSLLYSHVIADFKVQFSIVADAEKERLVAPTYVMPPLITNGPLAATYEAGPVDRFEHRMHTYNTISRHDIAHLMMALTEQEGMERCRPQCLGRPVLQSR